METEADRLLELKSTKRQQLIGWWSVGRVCCSLAIFNESNTAWKTVTGLITHGLRDSGQNVMVYGDIFRGRI